MAVDGVDNREAITRYRRLERFRSYDLVEAKLLTGRTHQIRVHFSHLGHPVFGDHDYGGREARVRGMFAPERPLARKMLELIGRQALHSRRLEFDHPVTGVKLTIEADFPDDFQTVLDLLSSGSG
jgi:23S rRNA pseudouridine1911/1915/1917 synthase